MKSSTAISGEVTAAKPKAPSRRVLDAPVRMLHWLLALSFLGVYLSAEGERLRLLHVTLGYTMAGLLIARILWGLFGTPTAHLKVLSNRLRAVPGWIKKARSGKFDLRQAIYLAQGITMVLVLLDIAILSVSGIAVYLEWIDGEWLSSLHSVLGDALLGLVLFHLGMLVLSSIMRRSNQMWVMISGRVAGAGPDIVKRSFGGIAAIVLGAVLFFWAWQWVTAPSLRDNTSSVASNNTQLMAGCISTPSDQRSTSSQQSGCKTLQQ